MFSCYEPVIRVAYSRVNGGLNTLTKGQVYVHCDLILLHVADYQKSPWSTISQLR